MIIDHRELSIGEDSISTVSHAAAQNTDKIGLTEDLCSQHYSKSILLKII
jgi:hypothetical protein